MLLRGALRFDGGFRVVVWGIVGLEVLGAGLCPGLGGIILSVLRCGYMGSICGS